MEPERRAVRIRVPGQQSRRPAHVRRRAVASTENLTQAGRPVHRYNRFHHEDMGNRFSVPGSTGAAGVVSRSGDVGRIRGGFQQNRARLGDQVPRHSRPGQPARLHAAAHRAAASRRLALRQGQRRVDPRQVQGVGPRRQDRNVRRALSHAQGARCSNWSRPRASRPSWTSPPSPAIPRHRSTTSSFPPTTRIPSMATSPRRWCT